MTSRFALPAEDVLRAREKVVLDHVRDEAAHDWDATLSTFPHPLYELIAQMVVYDGEAEVRGYWQFSRTAFPDQNHELIAFRHSHDAIIIELWLLGTHTGPLGKIPPTGSTHRTRMTAYFIFDENENLISERVYYDQLTIFKQLIGGLNKRSPRDLLTLARAVVGLLRMAGTAPDPRLTNTTPAKLED